MANFPDIDEEAIEMSRREQRLRRFKQVPIRFLLPNLITLAGSVQRHDRHPAWHRRPL